MSKGIDFWVDAWEKGRIPFHRNDVHPDLITFWPGLEIRPKSTILVPLCGKSRDMIWFLQQNYQVVGIELSEQAVLSFFQEQQMLFTVEIYPSAKKYCANSLSIWVGDIFSLQDELIPLVDAIYDRAALVALPQQLRPAYVRLCLNWLRPGGSIFLKSLSYTMNAIQGPPYSVSAAEVMQLYSANAMVHCVQRDEEHVTTLSQNDEVCLPVEQYVWTIIKNETKS